MYEWVCLNFLMGTVGSIFAVRTVPQVRNTGSLYYEVSSSKPKLNSSSGQAVEFPHFADRR